MKKNKSIILGLIVIVLLIINVGCNKKDSIKEIPMNKADIITETEDDSEDSEVEEEEVIKFAVGENKLTLTSDSKKVASKFSDKEMTDFKKIWNEILPVIPNGYMKYISTFEVVTSEFSGTVAAVYPNDDLSKWTISFETEALMPDEDGEYGLSLLMLHEFGHILTLNSSQADIVLEAMDANKVDKQTTYVDGFNVSKEKSYLNLFYQEFWKEIEEEFMKTNTDDFDVAHEFYLKHKDSFPTEYGVTNPSEDIAECFREFVINDKATGSEIKDQKVNFFYQFEELVAMRDELRTALKIN